MATVANTKKSSPRITKDGDITFLDVETATLIRAGNLAFRKSATSTDWQHGVEMKDISDGGTDTQNREAAADLFIGIFLDSSADGETEPVRVAGAGTELWLKQETAAAIICTAPLEPYMDTNPLISPGNSVVAGTSSPIAICIRTKASTVDKWVLCRILQNAVEIGLENS